MLVVKPNCTIEEVVINEFVISGNVGKYISVTNGPNAVSIPKKHRRNNRELFFSINENIKNQCKFKIKRRGRPFLL